jgi:hypothetical protein
MQHPYLQLFLAFVIAQGAMASMNVYSYQKEKNIDYWPAMVAYLKAEIGYFIIGAFAMAAICFIMPEFVDLHTTRADLLSKEKLDWKDKLQLYFKTSALLIGGFVQYIAFVYRKKGKAAIDKVADKLA